MNSYEITVVLMATAKDQEVLARIEKEVREAGGKIEETSEWGKRELAYPIKKQTEGVYYFMNISLPAHKTAEINRMLTTSEEFLRHLIVRTKSKMNALGQQMTNDKTSSRQRRGSSKAAKSKVKKEKTEPKRKSKKKKV